MRIPLVRNLVALVFGFVAVASPVIIWWDVSPYLTIKGLADASYDGDEARFHDYLDIPALRANALRRVEDDVHGSAGRSGRVRMNDHAVATLLMGPMIDRVFSRGTAFDMVHRKDHAYGRDVSYILMRDGPNYFEVRFTTPFPLMLKFQREGAEWKIIDMWVDGNGKSVLV